MKRIFTIIVVFTLLAGIIYSCKKDDNSTPSNSVQTNFAQNIALIQGVYTHVFNLVTQASNDTLIMNGGIGHLDGATVTYNSTSHTFTFNYSLTKSTNTTGGIFMATVSNGNIKDSAATCHITFNGYNINGYSVQGTNDIINMGGSSTKIFSDSVSNTRVIKGNDTTNFSALYHIEWDNGALTSTISDDQFTFQGNFSAYNNSSCSVTGSISPANKLKITTQCQYIVYGIINMVMNSLNSSNQNVTNNIDIDFISADGCNSQVNVTVDNTQYSFPL